MSIAEKFANRNRKMIIKGAGKFMAEIPGCGELITLGTMTNMRLDIQLDMTDIEGGDTQVPIDTLLRKKTIDITAEDAKFDLNMVRLATGAKLREGLSGQPYETVYETHFIPGGTSGSITLGGMPYGMGTLTVYDKTTNAFLTLGTDYSVAGNVITFVGAKHEGKEVIVYYSKEITDLSPDGFVWVLEEKHDISSVNSDIELFFPLFGGGVLGSKTDHVSVRLTKENKLLKQSSSNTPGEGEYYIDVTANKIIFNDYLNGEQVYVNYKRPEVVDVLELGSKDFPLTVHVVHDGQFEQKDGTIQAYQTELYACRVKSNFTIDAARQTASTHSITLTVIDPERADGRLGTIKRYQLPGQSEEC